MSFGARSVANASSDYSSAFHHELATPYPLTERARGICGGAVSDRTGAHLRIRDSARPLASLYYMLDFGSPARESLME